MCFAIIRTSTILDTNVLICMDKDVAYVGSVINKPKVWTIRSHDSEWAQCDCPIVNFCNFVVATDDFFDLVVERPF